MSDSTNAHREGHTKSESVVQKTIFDYSEKLKRGRIITTQFASNAMR